jgi:hypothetical protein
MDSPNSHQKITYGLLAATLAGLGWVGLASHKSADAFSVDQATLVQAIGDMSKREVAVMCAPGCGGRAKAMAKAFNDAGWPAKASSGMPSDPNTLHIFSMDADVYKTSDGIGKAAGLPVIFFTQEPDAGKIEILVGPVEDAQ